MPEDIAPTPETPSHFLIDRYRESYRIASATTGFGTVIKAFGWVVGALVLISGVLTSLNSYGPLKFVFAFGGFFSAALVVLVFYVIGTTVAAVGQTLRACVDIAVYASPFLSSEQQAEAMN